MRHAPFWQELIPKSRRQAYPRLKGQQTARVVVIGGGLTGAACAAVFAAAGIDLVLVEAGLVGGGMTAGDPGVLREGFAGSFHAAVGDHGVRTSRAVSDTMRRGSLDFATALRRYRIKCDLAPQEIITFAPPATDAARALRRDYEARHAAGVEGVWLTPAIVARETSLESGGAIRTRGSVIDPYRACAGLLGLAAARGARIHERSLVRRVRASSRHVDVVTEGGAIRAETVVVATAAAIQDLRGLRRHLRPEHAYGVVTDALPAASRRQVGPRRALLEDGREPGRLVRWLADDRVLLHGGRQAEVPARTQDRALVQRTGQLMYEFSLLFPAVSGLQPSLSWAGLDADTADGLPLLGPHRNFPRHLFAFGSSRHGAGLPWVAARLALRHFQGVAARADEALGFTRIL